MIILPKEWKCELCKNKKASVYWLNSYVCIDCKRKEYLKACEKTMTERKG